MKRVVLTIVFATLVVAAGTALAQPPWQAPAPAPPAQESPQAVKAAIPPQAVRPATPPTKPGEAVPPERPASGWSNTQFDETANVRVEITISYQVGQGAPVKRSASLVVASQNDSGSLQSGNQVPVPSTSFVPLAPAAKSDGSLVPSTPAAGSPVTSFSYRSVGLNLDARNVRVSGNRAKMNLNVEFSAIDEKAGDSSRGAGPGYPSFPTFSQNLAVVLENGKPLVIAQTSDIVDNVARKQSVEVTATILK